MLTFYFSPGSSSMAVHIALHEVGAKFDAKPLSLADKDTRKLKAVDHRTQDHRVGLEKLDILLVKLTRASRIDLKDTIGNSPGHENGNVHERNDAMVSEKGG